MIDLSWSAGRGAGRRQPSKSRIRDEPGWASLMAATLSSVVDEKFMRRQPKFTVSPRTGVTFDLAQGFPVAKECIKKQRNCQQ